MSIYSLSKNPSNGILMINGGDLNLITGATPNTKLLSTYNKISVPMIFIYSAGGGPSVPVIGVANIIGNTVTLLIPPFSMGVSPIAGLTTVQTSTALPSFLMPKLSNTDYFIDTVSIMYQTLAGSQVNQVCSCRLYGSTSVSNAGKIFFYPISTNWSLIANNPALTQGYTSITYQINS